MDDKPQAKMNSHEMGKRCEAMIQKLWEHADDILNNAIGVVDKVADGNWDRDHIRTQPITDKILANFGLKGNA